FGVRQYGQWVPAKASVRKHVASNVTVVHLQLSSSDFYNLRKCRCVVADETFKKARRRAGRILHAGSDSRSLAAAVMRTVFNHTVRLPQRKANLEQRLLHCCRRN